MSLKYAQFIEMMVEELGLENTLDHLVHAAISKQLEAKRNQARSRGMEPNDIKYFKEVEQRWIVIRDEITEFKEKIKALIP